MGLSGFLFISIQFLASGAHAWGLTTDLNTGWLNAQLVNHVIQLHEIDYCVQIADPRFAQGTIERQVAAVLPLWLKPLEDQGIHGITIRAVSCDSGSFNLKVEIGPEASYKTLGSYQLPQYQDGHFYSLVKVDSEYLYAANGKSYPIVDFETFSCPPGTSLDALMNSVSISSPATVQAFAAAQHLEYTAVFWSTYRLLIHEIGHSFGLCDTYPSQVHVHCDPAFMSADQPSSVMYDSNYFYLTQDDVTGIKALFCAVFKVRPIAMPRAAPLPWAFGMKFSRRILIALTGASCVTGLATSALLYREVSYAREREYSEHYRESVRVLADGFKALADASDAVAFNAAQAVSERYARTRKLPGHEEHLRRARGQLAFGGRPDRDRRARRRVRQLFGTSLCPKISSVSARIIAICFPASRCLSARAGDPGRHRQGALQVHAHTQRGPQDRHRREHGL